MAETDIHGFSPLCINLKMRCQSIITKSSSDPDSVFYYKILFIFQKDEQTRFITVDIDGRMPALTACG
ncbi:hypothetical protein [Musicola keenii]|uniref:hypothetical protein n=1 Tax=Musicola keenii TaxID=2884250 RepID=UPI0017871DB1|nr:hypothetical protein [Musicola keenii]